MIIREESYLMHYGTLRKSGRYPWGSGETQSARNETFLSTVERMKREGMSESDIAKAFSSPEHPMTSTDLRALKSIAGNEQKQAQIARAQRLKEKGTSNMEIGRQMGINESSVRSLLAPGAAEKAAILLATSNMLKDQVAKKGFIDIGSGVENQLGLSGTKLSTAVAVLKEEGYAVHNVLVDQLGTGPGNKTKIKVLAPPGTTYKDIVTNKDKISQIEEYSDNGGRSFFGLKPPINVSPDRIQVNYSKKNEKGDEIGGGLADGVIYVRPGVPDLSMGGKRYAQVRIAVNGTHYLKGMAMLKDDLPDGVDLVFNTNKTDKGDKLKAMKELKTDKDGNVDMDNPFGAVVRQLGDMDGDGRLTKVTSAMNMVNEEGDWEKWNKSLSTQLLSKQSPVLAKQQLAMTLERQKARLDEINALTNPAVKKKLLQEFADGADASAVHLKAAALPRQATQVILPVPTLKVTEIYAPNFRDGERVALIRYPHGGTFEIPELTVNNRHKDSIDALGKTARDAVGINPKVAERLSGADFDGDTVLVIPNNTGVIRTKPPLEKLKGFDPQSAYPPYDGMKTMGGGKWDAKQGKEVYPEGKSPSGRTKGMQMGLVSNLITDMTIKGASDDELARAVRHSMVVIDAEKHALNYLQSKRDNGIDALNRKYQPRADGRSTGGASTLISRAKSPVDVAERKPRAAKDGGPIDKATGKKVFVETGDSYVNAKGQLVIKTTTLKKLEATDDANTLSSGTRMETIYAEHSNKMKTLADEARRVMVNTPNTPYSPSAKAAYAEQVRSLNAALNIALKNRPLERQAQVLANAVVAQKKAAYPDMDKADLKKIQGQALFEMRQRTGAGKTMIDPTPEEWDAIQAGAISTNKLEQILANSKPERIQELATPRQLQTMTAVSTTRARSMANSGYTQAEIADALGVSVSTVQSTLDKGEEGSDG